NFDVGGGPTSVLGPSGRNLNDGGNFTMGAGYNFNPRAGYVLEFSNSWLGVSDTALQNNQAIDGSAQVWSVTLNPIWRFPIGGPVGGYLIAGGGFYNPGIATVRQFDDAGGLNAGAGLTCNLGWGTKLFVEARYHYLFTSGY